jgi:hypothetical protein
MEKVQSSSLHAKHISVLRPKILKFFVIKIFTAKIRSAEKLVAIFLSLQNFRKLQFTQIDSNRSAGFGSILRGLWFHLEGPFLHFLYKCP